MSKWFETKSTEELQEWIDDAREAYESGNQIVSDEEYDEVIQYLGLENNAEIGSEDLSKSKAYTVKHDIIMGSLDKVHTIMNDKKEINFAHSVYPGDKSKDVCVTEKVMLHLSKANNPEYIEFTPKLDGCSFDLTCRKNNEGKYILSCSTRGDTHYGADILKQMQNSHFKENFSMLYQASDALLVDGFDVLIIRGEAIVRNSVYNKKYANDFKNTRVFVAGNLNREFNENDADHTEHVSMLNDIDYICYDYRRFNSKTNDYQELSWMNPNDSSYKLLEPFLGNIGQLPDLSICHNVKLNNRRISTSEIEKIYWKFSEYRKEITDYPMDGIVLKPNCSSRLKNLDRYRPLDMIAIKFLVEKMQSKIVDIVWSVGMTGECYPKAIINPVYQDGKEITKASLHGYSYLLEKHVGIGSEVSIVMNGDIIPGVDEVLSEGEIKMPNFKTYVAYKGIYKTPHLMRKLNGNEVYLHKFVVSAKALAIDGIKDKTANRIWVLMHEAYKMVFNEELSNLMQLMNEKGHDMLLDLMGESKSTRNIIDSLETYRKNVKLNDVIRGLCIEGCGDTISNMCARVYSGLDYDKTGLNEAAYQWIFDKNSENYQLVEKYCKLLNVSKLSETTSTAETSDASDKKIPVILTGVTTDAGYATKKDWLKAHPQYIMVDDNKAGWSVCKILFTNNTSSTTSKMKKAKKLGIEIRKYEK